jgi:hypothetical protein
MVETNGVTVSLRMMAAGHVDYAVASLILGTREIAKMGLSGKIAPLFVSQRDRRRNLCLLQQGASFALVGGLVLARIEAIQADRRVQGDTAQVYL